VKLKTATCERSGKNTPLSEGALVARPSTGEWLFISMDEERPNGDYCIAVGSFLDSPDSPKNWIAHLKRKTWFDAQKFADFLHRFQKDNNLASIF